MGKVVKIVFSPTGASQKAAGLLADAFAGEQTTIDLCQPSALHDGAAAGLQAAGPAAGDVCIIAMPCYGGRLPQIAAQRLSALRGNGCPAVICVTFGNRAFEDSLLELADLAAAAGFEASAACALACEHNIVNEFGRGRPDSFDIGQIREFAAAAADKVASGRRGLPVLPGRRPYKEWKSGQTPITVDEQKCTACGTCLRGCPACAISASGRKTDASACIGCMRCIKLCPQGSRSLPAEYLAKLRGHLEPLCRERKANQFFL